MAFISAGLSPHRPRSGPAWRPAHGRALCGRSWLRPEACRRCWTASATQSSAAAVDDEKQVLTRFMRLQNSSDIRGVALDLEKDQPVTLTPEQVAEIAAAFVRFTAQKIDKPVEQIRIGLGRDSRISGPDLLKAAALGVSSTGARASDFGLATTPALFMCTVLRHSEEVDAFDGAIVLTASHLPPNRNGMKFFNADGGTSKADIKTILNDASRSFLERSQQPIASTHYVEATPVNFMSTYEDHLVGIIRRGCDHPTHYDTPLQGLRVLVDAGNGAGGFFADKVLRRLGADTSGSQFLDPDGFFPNHTPNPEDKKATEMTTEAVERVHADLGIVFDTDVDRSAVVAADGRVVNRNRLIAMMSSIVLKENPGATIVTDSTTSNGLARFIESLGGVHLRFKRGYKNVIDKGAALNADGVDAPLAIETSGHGAMRENYMLDDGAYLVVKILIELVRLARDGDKRGVLSLIDGLQEPREEGEFRLKFRDPEIDFKAYGADVLKTLPEFAAGMDGWQRAEQNYEGYRFSVKEQGDKEGWVLLRQSLHDPLLVLNVESEEVGGARAIAEKMREFLARYDELKLDTIDEYLETH